jgi:hypothetical protein
MPAMPILKIVAERKYRAVALLGFHVNMTGLHYYGLLERLDDKLSMIPISNY